jgi:hypothetical protein
MSRVAKSVKAHQSFRGGLNDLSKNPYIQALGSSCCEPAAAVDQDRLNPTINPENALIHTRPFGNRDYWQFGEFADSERARIVQHINTHKVGAQLEILVVPTFSLLYSVQAVVFAEEIGLKFKVKTRNGTKLPSGQLIKVAEKDGGSSCGEVERTQSVGDLNDIGSLDGATRVHTLAVSDIGGEFALEADVLILEVTSMPSIGVVGNFDLRVHTNYIAPGRSEAAM